MSDRLLSETKPKARKAHTCIWCGENIVEGENYIHQKSVYDGRIQDHKWHVECLDDSSEYFRHEEEFEPYEADRPSERLGFSSSNTEAEASPR